MKLAKVRGYGHMGFQAYPLFFIGNILNLELKDDEFPILDLSNLESCYHNNTKDNMFTYYFDQPEIIEEDIVKTSSNFYFPNAFIYAEERIKYHNAFKKYLKIKPHILEKAENFKKQHFDGHKILGLHVRGISTNDRPKLPFDYYKHKLDLYLEKEGYDKIFLCVEHQHTLDKFIKTYGDKLILYPSYKFSHRGHQEFNLPFPKENNEGYIKGEDVLIESILLSYTDFLLKTVSNVSTFPLVYNIDLKYCNIDFHFWDSNNYTYFVNDQTFKYDCKYETRKDIEYYINQKDELEAKTASLIHEWQKSNEILKEYL